MRAGREGGRDKIALCFSVENPAVTAAIAPKKIVIASRESRLAMWQAEHIRDRLSGLYPGAEVGILGMTTRGDQILDRKSVV